MNKLVDLGLSILEVSKILMYKILNWLINPKYQQNYVT